MSDTLHILLRKIDRFIRRYYANQLLKGLILFGAALFILSILFIGLEYFGYFSTNVRFTLFYAFILFNGFVLVKYVILPLLGMIRIGKRISRHRLRVCSGNTIPMRSRTRSPMSSS